jgi:hypothetical protein
MQTREAQRSRKTIKEMRGLQDIPRFLGKDSLKLRTQQVNNILKTGEWPKDYIDFVTTVLKKKPKAVKIQASHMQQRQ